VENANHSFEEVMSGFAKINDALKAQKLNPIATLSKEDYDKRESTGGGGRKPPKRSRNLPILLPLW